MSLLLGMPLLMFLALLPVMLASVFIVHRSGTDAIAGRYTLSVVSAVLLVAVLAHLWFAVIYLFAPGFRDHIEPNTAVVAWLFSTGQDIYHPIDAAERYSFLYGPLAYITSGTFFTIFGASTFSAKLAGLICLALCFIGITATVARITSGRWMPVIIALGYCALLALFFKNHSFWSKPDPFMMAAVAFGLFACVVRNRHLAWLLCGLCLGLAVNAKITGAVYFLPIFAWIFERDGFRAVLISGLMAGVVALLPFLASNISLQNYLSLLQAAGDHGISAALLIQNVMFVLLAILPVVAFLLYERYKRGRFSSIWNHKWVTAASVLSIALILIAASKPGSGPHHFLPFLPLFGVFVAYAFMQVYADSEGMAAGALYSVWLAFLVAITIKSSFALYYGLLISNPTFAQAVHAELRDVMNDYAGRHVYMGYGDGSTYVSTFTRDQLAYAGNPYLIDASAMMDFQFSGIEIPDATIETLLADETAVWLIPTGKEPFSIVNYYYRKQNGLLFDEKFRQAFMNNFILEKTTTNFDVYTRQ